MERTRVSHSLCAAHKYVQAYHEHTPRRCQEHHTWYSVSRSSSRVGGGRTPDGALSGAATCGRAASRSDTRTRRYRTSAPLSSNTLRSRGTQQCHWNAVTSPQPVPRYAERASSNSACSCNAVYPQGCALDASHVAHISSICADRYPSVARDAGTQCYTALQQSIMLHHNEKQDHRPEPSSDAQTASRCSPQPGPSRGGTGCCTRGGTRGLIPLRDHLFHRELHGPAVSASGGA